MLLCISVVISHAEHFFWVPGGCLHVLFGKMSAKIFWPFFDWDVCFFDIELYEQFEYFEILLVTLFANIFSHSAGCLFILFMVSFAVQKLLSLFKSHFFMFVFIFITLGRGSKKIVLWFISKWILPKFSSKTL